MGVYVVDAWQAVSCAIEVVLGRDGSVCGVGEAWLVVLVVGERVVSDRVGGDSGG